MDENTTKIIKEKFDSLPESIQQVILSSNYEDALVEISNKYQLTVEQMSVLERETTMVMMGLTPTKDFEGELTRELHVDNLKGTSIAKDVNDKIFLKIRELLKLMNTPSNQAPYVEDPEEKTTLKKDAEILKSAGIEITPTPGSFTKADTVKENTHPILAQKISGSFQTPTVKTEYSLNNLSKTKELPSGSPVLEIPKKEMKETPEMPPIPKPSINPAPSPVPELTPAPKITADIKMPSANVEAPSSYLKNKDPYRLSPDE